MQRTLAFAIAFFLCASVCAAESPIRVTLQLEPAITLPGLPVSMRLTMTNKSTKPVNVPGRIVLAAHKAGGDSFLVRQSFSGPVLTPEGWVSEELKPRQTVARTLLTEAVIINPLAFADTRLNDVGVFDLQAFVGNDLRNEMTLPDIQQNSAASNVVTLTVASPKADDLAVWRLMLAAGNGVWATNIALYDSGKALARRVVAEYPKSAYAPWFITFGAAWPLEEREAQLRAWLEKAPADAYTEWRWLRVAIWDINIADTYERTNPEYSQAFAKKAREVLKPLLRSADEDLRASALERLEYLDDPG